MVKNLSANEGDIRDSGLILGWEDLLEEDMATHSCILAWRIHGQRNLVGYGTLGCKESDMTEHLSTREYYKQLYASKFNNLDKMNKLLERQTAMLLQEEIT